MDAISNRAIDALGPYPVLQGVVGVLVILACLYVAVRASRDKPTQQNIPQYFLVGPLHDAFEDIRTMAEQGRAVAEHGRAMAEHSRAAADQSRQQTELLRRMDDHVDHLTRQMEIAKATLEVIRNESRLR